MQPRRLLLALALVVILAAALRLPFVAADGLTSDEAFSWRLVQYPLCEMLRRAGEDVHPPLFYLLLKPWVAAVGDAPLGLRGLSLLLGLLVVALMPLLLRETEAAFDAEAPPGTPGGGAFAGLLAALLVALHPAHVLASLNARMYTLSTLLALVSTGLLLRAIRRRSGYWLYGVAVAAAGYAHYYAFFTVGAQGLAALALAWPSRRGDGGRAFRRLARGLLAAAGTALLVYLPWLPVFWAQARRVGADYWIPAVTWEGLVQAGAEWLVGVGPGAFGLAAATVICLLLLAAVALALRGARAAEVFLLAQALGPWLLAVAVSVGSGRSVFLPRYLVPTHVFLIAFFALRTGRVAKKRRRLAVALGLVAASGLALVHGLGQLPTGPLAEAQAAAFLAPRHRAGDVVLTDSPRALNRLRYVLAQNGLRKVDGRCLLTRTDEETGHFTHTAALGAGEAVRPADLATLSARRLWWLTPTSVATPLPARGWTRVIERAFHDAWGTHAYVARFVPARK